MSGIYGDYLDDLKWIQVDLSDKIDGIREDIRRDIGMDPVEHCLSRIKEEDSMREKCRRKGLPETPDSALFVIRDALGFRIVCAFVDDVYTIRDRIAKLEGYEIIEEKDYIRHAKPNGYRSYHIILRVGKRFYVEVQLRTISMDTWASLEHHMRYKKEVNNEQLIMQELKRCADELASTDISMQTIRDMILRSSDS